MFSVRVAQLGSVMSRVLKFVVFFGLASVAIALHVLIPPVPYSKLDRLAAGIARSDTERLLGKPRAVLSPSAFGAVTWRYSVPFRFGWVDVFFDERGRVLSHNCERF